MQGSPRFGTLGEATINLSSYIGQETFTASLPLIHHCSRGAILQVRILFLELYLTIYIFATMGYIYQFPATFTLKLLKILELN